MTRIRSALPQTAAQQRRRIIAMQIIRTKIRSMAAGSAAAAVVTAAALAGMGTAGATSSLGHRPHPQHAGSRSANAVTGTPAAFSQEFGTNRKYFCPGLGNAPCDGKAGDYGTIDRVASGFSNGGSGNYAPFTHAYDGGFFALTSGTQAANLGVNCPADSGAGNESCTGPYALFPVSGKGRTSWGGATVFPSGGFTVTNDLYLSPSTAGSHSPLIDDDVELNNSSGAFGIDNIVGVCYNSTAGGFTVNFSHNTGNCTYTPGTTPVITSDGWYRFVFVFSGSATAPVVTENVYRDTSGTLTNKITSGPQSAAISPPGPAGGPGYFWLPDDDVSGLPLANFALQSGTHPFGYTP
jgi:hypothetical protein